MAINTKKPPIKETVGAQYYCFNNMTDEGEWTEAFEADVTKTEVVKSVKVTESAEATDVYASGKVYDTDNSSQGSDIEVEVIAFPVDDLARMRGDSVDSGGLILSGGNRIRPFFGYGKVVVQRGDRRRYEWYPKCKLSENTDEAKTSEKSFSEQTDTITIKAYAFNDAGDIKVMVDSAANNFPEGLTEEMFFAKPVLCREDLAAAVAGT